MKITDVTKPYERILVVHPDDLLTQVAARLAAADLRLACVCIDRRLLGVVSLADTRAATAAATSVGAVMTARPIVCAPTDSAEHVLDLMQQHEVRCLPVVDKGMLVGLVSLADLLKRTRAQAKRDVEFLTAFVFG